MYFTILHVQHFSTQNILGISASRVGFKAGGKCGVFVAAVNLEELKEASFAHLSQNPLCCSSFIFASFFILQPLDIASTAVSYQLVALIQDKFYMDELVEC